MEVGSEDGTFSNSPVFLNFRGVPGKEEDINLGLFRLEELDDKTRCLRTEFSGYKKIGYDSENNAENT